MSDRPIPPPEQRLDDLREQLARLHTPSPFIDALLAAAAGGAAGTPAGPGAALLSGFTSACVAWAVGRGTAIALERVQEIAWRLTEEVARMQAQGMRIRWDEDSYLELVNRVLPLAVNTRSQEKRRRFAALLANAAPASDDEREVARTMAILLDQLDEREVLLLDRAVKVSLPEGEIDEKLGAVRYAPLPAVRYEAAIEGPAWIRLHNVGLLSGGIGMGMRIEGQGYKGSAVIITPLGVSLHRWVSEPV